MNNAPKFILTLVSLLMFTIFLGCDGGTTGSADTQAPTGTILIGNGAPYTQTMNVSLTLSATDDDAVTEMRVSEDITFSGAAWLGYAGTLDSTLSSGDGYKTVYAQFRDGAGNESAIASDDIILAANSTTTVIYFYPDPLNLQIGAEGTVNLMVLNAQALNSARFEISFDHSKVEVTDLDVGTVANHILGLTGAAVIVSDETYDNSTGRIIVGALAQQNYFSGVNGNGPFAEIRFRANVDLDTPTELSFDQSEIYVYGNPPQLATNVYIADGYIEAP